MMPAEATQTTNFLIFYHQCIVTDDSVSVPDQSYKRLTMSQIQVSASWL
jgi:hypothetical protein